MKLDEYKKMIEAQRNASLKEAVIKMSQANAKIESLFNLKEMEINKLIFYFLLMEDFFYFQFYF